MRASPWYSRKLGNLLGRKLGLYPLLKKYMIAVLLSLKILILA